MKKLLLLLVVLLGTTLAGIAQTTTASGTFTKYTPNSTKTYTFGDVTWNIDVTWVNGVPGAMGVTDNGAQIGSASKAPNTITLTTDFFVDKTITEISINATQSGSANITGIFKVAGQQVGDAFSCKKNAPQNFSASNINKSGSIEIVLTNSNKANSNNGAAYLKSISVTYTTGQVIVIAPETITFDPTNGNIDTNTSISLATDQNNCEIRYAIDAPATKSSTKYTTPFTLSTGEHTVNAIAWNSANEDTPISASTTYTVTKAVGPITAEATITFANHSDWKYTANKTKINWTSDDNVYTFPTEAGINDESGSTGTTYPQYVTSGGGGFRIYYSSRSFVNVNAPEGYYFVSLSWTTDKPIKIDRNATTNNQYKFSGKPTTFKITAANANATLTKMTIVLAKLGKDAVATPTFSIPNGSEVEVGKSVTISSKTEGATIIGSINETMIEGEALPYTYTFTTAGDYTIEVVASKDGLDDSEEAKATYKVVNPKVATPIFSIASGSTFEVGEKLTISSETDGATITGFINETPIDGEALPYTYTFTTAGDYTIEVVASKDGLDDSEEAKATYTVTEFAAPAAPVFSLADMSSTPAGTVVSISAQGATSIVVKTYGIDGLVAATKTIEGNAATVTVDKMHRRFAAAAVRAANGNSATSTEVEAFYNIGNRGDAADTYTLVTSTDELYDGMEFVIGVEGTQNIVMTTSANNYDRIWYGGAATFSNNEVTTLPDNAMILVLEAAPNGEWYLRTKNEISYYDNADEDKSYRNTPRIGYLYDYSNPQNTSQNYLQMSSQPKASTPIAYNDNDGNATITFGIIHDAESDFIIRYNTNTTPSGFSMYATTMSANSYPLPRIYAKKAAIIEPDGYTMAFHHTPVALNNGQNKIAAVENPVALTATDNEDGTYTFTSNAGDITDLCGQFAVSVEGELLSGHISEAKTDFSDNHDSNCQATEHAPYVVVINNETKTLALASNENSVPLSTNTDDHHGKTVHHAAPVISVNLNPFRNINMTLASPEGTVTGIEDITVEGGEVEYYNLQGIRVANPENGIFIRREGNKATKVIL